MLIYLITLSFRKNELQKIMEQAIEEQRLLTWQDYLNVDEISYEISKRSILETIKLSVSLPEASSYEKLLRLRSNDIKKLTQETREKLLDGLMGKYWSNFKRYDIIFCILILASLFISDIELYYYFQDALQAIEIVEEGKPITKYIMETMSEGFFCSGLRIAIAIINIVLLVLIFKRRSNELSFRTVKEGRRVRYSVFRGPGLWFWVVEVLVVTVFSPPLINFPIEIYQSGEEIVYKSSDALFNLLTQFRGLYFVRLSMALSFYNSMETKRLCDQYYVDFSKSFIMRCILKSSPYPIVLLWLTSSCFVFGYSMRLLEVAYMHRGSINWHDQWNGYWNAIITLSTVGYGDTYAKTNTGRVIAILIMFWGVFINSMILVAMNISAEMTRQETKAFEDLCYINSFIEMGEYALKFVQSQFFASMIKKRTTSSRFKALSFSKQYYWIGKAKKCMIQFHGNRETFMIDDAVLELDKEMEEFNLKLDNLWDESKKLTKCFEEFYKRIEGIEKQQIKIIEELGILDSLQGDHYATIENKSKADANIKSIMEETLNGKNFQNESLRLKEYIPENLKKLKFQEWVPQSELEMHFYTSYMKDFMENGVGLKPRKLGGAPVMAPNQSPKRTRLNSNSNSNDLSSSQISNTSGIDTGAEFEFLKNYFLNIPDSSVEDEENDMVDSLSDEISIEAKPVSKQNTKTPRIKKQKKAKKEIKKSKNPYNKVLGVDNDIEKLKVDRFGFIAHIENTEMTDNVQQLNEDEFLVKNVIDNTREWSLFYKPKLITPEEEIRRKMERGLIDSPVIQKRKYDEDAMVREFQNFDSQPSPRPRNSAFKVVAMRALDSNRSNDEDNTLQSQLQVENSITPVSLQNASNGSKIAEEEYLAQMMARYCVDDKKSPTSNNKRRKTKSKSPSPSHPIQKQKTQRLGVKSAQKPSIEFESKKESSIFAPIMPRRGEDVPQLDTFATYLRSKPSYTIQPDFRMNPHGRGSNY